MVGFVAGFDAAEDRQRVFHGRFADIDRLEAAFEGRILFDMLAVLVERRGSDAAQLAAGQRRLEQVGGIRAAFRLARADHRMQFVHEQNDFAAGVVDFAEHGFQTFLEFAAELGAGDQSAQVERNDAFIAEALRHIALDDPQRQPFGDRRLADARFANQYRIVFRAARQHLDHATDFLIAADDRVELALAGPFDQIDAELSQRLVFVLGTLVGDSRRTADRQQRLPHIVIAHALHAEQIAGGGIDVRQRQQ